MFTFDLYEDEDDSADANAIDTKQCDGDSSDDEASEENDVIDDAEDSTVWASISVVIDSRRRSISKNCFVFLNLTLKSDLKVDNVVSCSYFFLSFFICKKTCLSN